MIPKMTKTIIHMPPPRNLVCEARAASDGPHGRSYLKAPSSFSPSAAGDSAGHRNGAVTHRLSRDRPWPRQIPIPRIRPTGLKAAFSGISVSWQYVGPLCGPKDAAVSVVTFIYMHRPNRLVPRLSTTWRLPASSGFEKGKRLRTAVGQCAPDVASTFYCVQ